jgi:hypothetical protein
MIEPNPFETLRQIAAGYCLSRGLHVVADLAIADKLDEVPRTAVELAVSVGGTGPRPATSFRVRRVRNFRRQVPPLPGVSDVAH